MDSLFWLNPQVTIWMSWSRLMTFYSVYSIMVYGISSYLRHVLPFLILYTELEINEVKKLYDPRPQRRRERRLVTQPLPKSPVIVPSHFRKELLSHTGRVPSTAAVFPCCIATAALCIRKSKERGSPDSNLLVIVW